MLLPSAGGTTEGSSAVPKRQRRVFEILALDMRKSFNSAPHDLGVATHLFRSTSPKHQREKNDLDDSELGHTKLKRKQKLQGLTCDQCLTASSTRAQTRDTNMTCARIVRAQRVKDPFMRRPLNDIAHVDACCCAHTPTANPQRHGKIPCSGQAFLKKIHRNGNRAGLHDACSCVHQGTGS